MRSLSEYLASLGPDDTDLDDAEEDVLTEAPADGTAESNAALERLLTGWLLDMQLRGLSAKTSLLFFDIVSALYSTAVKEGRAASTEAFRRVKGRTRLILEESCTLSSAECDTIMGIARKAGHHSTSHIPSAGADILLLSLLRGAIPPADILRWRRSDVEDAEEMTAEIVGRHASTRRQYIFDITPRPVTRKGWEKRARSMISPILSRAGITSRLTESEIIATVWARAALKCGLSPEDVIAIAGESSAGLPLLRLFTPSSLDNGERRQLIDSLSPVFADDPLRWYAMRLRPKTGYEQLQERLESLKGEVVIPQLFYPSEEIAQRTGKRLVFASRPVIRDVVFFQSRTADILPLFSRIGDLAWCYTTTGRPGAPYAPISRRAFERFQQTIGSFTPEYEVAPWGTLRPRVGERVVMVGGFFAGQEANIDKVTGGEDGPAIYRLQFYSSNGIEWRVNTNHISK